MKLKAYAGVARAPFLLLSVTLVAAGSAAGYYKGDFNWLHSLLAMVGLVALHAAVNAFNEVSDMRTGIDLRTQRTPFSGGSGTLPAGLIQPRAALAFALTMSLLGLVIGVYFLYKFGLIFLPILVLGAVCVLAYTDVLARAGIGEIAAGLGLGLLPVMGAALVQAGRLSETAVATGIPAFFMTFNLLFLNEFPDEEADRAGGRRHLVILLGRRRAALVYATAALLTPISIAAAIVVGVLPKLSWLAVAPSLLLAQPLRWAFSRPNEPVPLTALAANVNWNLLTNSLMAISLAVA